MNDPNTAIHEYANFGLRLTASIIDSFLSFVFLSPLLLGVTKILGISETSHITLSQLSDPSSLQSPEMQAMLPQLLHEAFLNLALQSLVIGGVFLFFWKKGGATPGKRLLHLKIIDAKMGASPSYKQSFVRFIGYFISTLPLCLGFLWIKWDKKNQGFHDKMANTYVIKIPRRSL